MFNYKIISAGFKKKTTFEPIINIPSELYNRSSRLQVIGIQKRKLFGELSSKFPTIGYNSANKD